MWRPLSRGGPGQLPSLPLPLNTGPALSLPLPLLLPAGGANYTAAILYVTDNRTESQESTTDEEVFNEETAGRSPRNGDQVHSGSLAPLSESNSVGVSPRVNGRATPSSSSPESCGAASVDSPCKGNEFDFPQLDSEVGDDQALPRNTEKRNSTMDGQWKRLSYDDEAEDRTSSVNHCRRNSVHGSERNDDAPIACSTPEPKSRGSDSQENRHASLNSKSFRLPGADGNDSGYSETISCSSTWPEDAESQTTRSVDCPSNPHSPLQKPVSGCGGVTVNGCGGSAPVMDRLPIDVSAEDDEGVVFDTSNSSEVVFAVKPENDPSSGLMELGEPIADRNSLDWDEQTPDLPRNTPAIPDECKSSHTENDSGSREYMEYADESPVEPAGNGVRFSSGTSRSRDAVNGPSSPSHCLSFSAPVAAPVFSDISDDDDDDDGAIADGESVDDRSADAEKSRLLPSRNENRPSQRRSPTVQQAEAEVEAENAHSYDNTAALPKNNTERDRREDVGPLKTASLNSTRTHPQTEECSTEVAATEVCRNAEVRDSCADAELRDNSSANSDDVPTQPNDIPYLQSTDCTEMCPLTELDARNSTSSVPVWDCGRMRGRRRNGSTPGGIQSVVDMLLKRCGAFEADDQLPELEFDVLDQNLETLERELFIAPIASPNLRGGNEPLGSPMDEAPLLLAITDLLEDAADEGGPGEMDGGGAAAADGDDAEVAMPVIGDMRPLLTPEDGDKSDDGAPVSRRNGRKTSQPRKRASPAAREVFDVERTRGLPVACDRCTFSCGTELALHRHIRTCHRARATAAARRFACVECAADFDDRESFLEHVAHHPGQHAVRYYACAHCATDAVDVETMERHVAGSHDGDSVRYEVVRRRVAYLDSLVDCPLCAVAFRWKNNFVDHLRKCHRMEQLADCIERGCRSESCAEKVTIRSSGEASGQSSRRSFHVSASAADTSGGSRYRDLPTTTTTTNSGSPQSVLVHVCSRCTFSTDDVESYVDHYRDHFAGPRVPRPARAPAVAAPPPPPPPPPRNAQQHQQPAVEQRGGNAAAGSFACHLCPFTSPKRRFYFRHMAIHERNDGMTDGFRCGYCQFAHPRLSCITFHLGRCVPCMHGRALDDPARLSQS